MRTGPRALALTAALTLVSAGLRADRFEDALALAKASAAAPGGFEFERRIAERFDEKKLRDALVECATTAREDDAGPFTALLELSGDGRASQVLLRPPLPVAVCLRWTIRETTFPRPARPGTWVAVDVNPRRAPGAPPIPTAGVATATVPPTPTPLFVARSAPALSPSPSAPPPPPAASPVRVTPSPQAARAASTPTGVPGASPAPTPRPAPPAASDVAIDFTAGAAGFHVDKRRPDLAVLRRTLAESHARFVGPILAQSDGISPDDPRLEPYWSLAEELNLPVVIPLGPVDRDEAGDRYRVALGDPLKLESVLARHPRLTLVVSGAGWPFADAMVGVMWRYPRVYVDTGGIGWALSRPEFEGYLARLVGAGLKDQILFASGASTAPRMAKALDAIRSSEVLTPEAKNAILRGNAERLRAALGAPTR